MNENNQNDGSEELSKNIDNSESSDNSDNVENLENNSSQVSEITESENNQTELSEPPVSELVEEKVEEKIKPFDAFVRDLINITKDKKRFVWTALLAISILTGIIYYNVLDNSKHFDDDFIFINPDFQNPDDYQTIFKVNAFRFVTFYTFSHQMKISGDDLSQYYIVNILIHIINSFLVFLISYSLLASPKLANSKVAEYREILSLFIAIIYAVHPIQTQAVSYIYQRLALVGGLFYFSAIYFYIVFRLSDKKFYNKIWLLLLSILSITLGLFSKENTFTIPGIIILLEISLLSKRKSVSLIFILLSFILVIVGVLLFFMFQIPERVFFPQENFDGHTIHSLNYFFTQFLVFPKYFMMMLFPLTQSIDHDITIANTINDGGVIPGMIFVGITLIIALLSYKNYKLIFFGIIWIYITLAVESSFIPVADVINEHRLYLPMFGFLLILAQLAGMFLNKDENLKKLIIIMLVMTGIYSIKTIMRNKVWQTEYTLWADAAKKAPNKARAQFKWAVAAFDSGKTDIALSAFNRTVELNPKLPSVYSYLGAMNAQARNFQQAIDYYSKFIELTHRRSKHEGYISRARLYRVINKIDSSKQDYKNYLQSIPADNQVLNEVANLYNSLGQQDSIEVLFKIVANADKVNFEPTFNLAMDYFNKKEYNKSLEYLNTLVDNDKIAPEIKSDIFNLRGTVFFYLDDKVSASIDYENAVALNTSNLVAWRNKAMVHRQSKEYELEKQAIDKMSELVPNEPQLLILKGRNFYNLKDYKEAKNYLEQLIKIDPSHKEANELLRKMR